MNTLLGYGETFNALLGKIMQLYEMCLEFRLDTHTHTHTVRLTSMTAHKQATEWAVKSLFLPHTRTVTLYCRHNLHISYIFTVNGIFINNKVYSQTDRHVQRLLVPILLMKTPPDDGSRFIL